MANLRDQFAPDEDLSHLTPSAKPAPRRASDSQTPTPVSQPLPQLPERSTPIPEPASEPSAPDDAQTNGASLPSIGGRERSGSQGHTLASRNAGSPTHRDSADHHHLPEASSKDGLRGNVKKQLARRGIMAGCLAVAAEGVVVLLVVVVLFVAAMSFTGPGGTDDALACTAECGVNGDIVATGKQFAWETSGHGYTQADAKPNYVAAVKKYNPHTDTNPYSDCGIYTATTMRASGVDPSYAGRGTGLQWSYVTAHPEKYRIIDVSSTADLQPGDVLFRGAGGGGHTSLYIGPQPLGDPFESAIVLSASLETPSPGEGHVPQVSIWYPAMNKAARFIGAAS